MDNFLPEDAKVPRSLKRSQILRLVVSEVWELIGLPYLYEIMKAHFWEVRSTNEMTDEKIEETIRYFETVKEKIIESPNRIFRFKAQILDRALWHEQQE